MEYRLVCNKKHMKAGLFLRILLMLVIYFGLTYYGGDLGKRILYPIRLFVTFLHEFGHAVGALITGGWVEEIQINRDGSGWTRSANGNRAITIMGGYLGSALFGNILFLIGAKAKPLVKPMLALLALSMVVTALYWYNSMFTTMVLLGFSAALLFIMMWTSFGSEILMFFGLASVLYIIQDFNVGPKSDLKAYEEVMVILPANVWMYIWLAVAVLLTILNLKLIWRLDKRSEI